MENSIKYYAKSYADPILDDEIMNVCKVYGRTVMSVYNTSIQIYEGIPENYTPDDCTEITREQFDEFYKKTVEKINSAAHV